MSANRLYHFIQLTLSTHNIIPGAVSFSNRQHSLGKQYFLFELAIQNKMKIGLYTLQNHHVSVYEGPIGVLDLKSQYHYTAILKDDLNNTYRLHVYFDANDNLVERPFLSRCISENNYQTVNSDDDQEAFKLLAHLSIQNLIRFLREKLNAQITIYQTEYDEIEKHADWLFQQLPKSKEKYLLTLDKLIHKIDQIAACITPDRVLLGKKAFLNSLKESVGLMNIPEYADTHTTSLLKNNSHEKSTSTPALFSPLKEHPKKFILETQKEKLGDVLKNLDSRFMQTKEMNGNLQLTTLTEIFHELTEKELFLEFDKIEAIPLEIKQLKMLKEKVQETARKILEKLLVQGEFEQAKMLNVFYHLIATKNLLTIALLLNKPALLDMLLTNNLISVHTKNIAINNFEYSSMVDYCFKQNKNRSKIECLSVLIKHGASLMEVDSECGLPYAAQLILDPNHPMCEAIKNNEENTVWNVVFYKQLNQVLNMLKIQPDSTDEKLKLLTCLINLNEKTIDVLSINHQYKIDTSNEIYTEFNNEIKDILCKELICRLQMDPDFISIQTRMNAKQKQFIKKLNYQERMKLKNSIPESLQKLKECLSVINSLDQWPSFESVKAGAIKAQINAITILDLYDELRPLQKKIKSTQLTNTKGPKSYRQDLSRQTYLIEEIKKLSDALNNPLKLMSSYNKARNALTDFINSLSNIAKDLESLSRKTVNLNQTEELVTYQPSSSTFFSCLPEEITTSNVIELKDEELKTEVNMNKQG